MTETAETHPIDQLAQRAVGADVQPKTENPHPQELKESGNIPDLSSEQAQFAERFDANIHESSLKEQEARQLAGEKLQQLHGKDLVKAGVKQAFFGATAGTLMKESSRTLGVITGGAVGAFSGGTAGVVLDRMTDRDSDIPIIGAYGGLAGGSIAGNMAGIAGGELLTNAIDQKYISKKENMRLKWYDWAGGNVFRLASNCLPDKLRKIGMNIEFFMNPTTFAGLRHIAQGFVQMGQDSYRSHKAQQIETQPTVGEVVTSAPTSENR
jgi:hypothetical protein